jgi:hypothetical protein
MNPLIDNYAHLGGLIWGCVAAAVIVKPVGAEQQDMEHGGTMSFSRRTLIAGGVLVTLSVVFLIVAFTSK